jgi:SAM-dependent methyltransferase
MLHNDRGRAESFGRNAERYDRSRPSYPGALFDAILPPCATVLDVGCGTGIAARAMVARGARVVGVEIDPLMAEVARRHGIEVEVGPFEEWDAGGRTFDVLTAGQAWHWIDPAAGAAKAARVLRPGGRLALFWNVGDPPADVAAALEEVYAGIAPQTDRYSLILGYSRGEKYTDQIEGILSTGDFQAPVRETFPWSRSYTRDEWIDQLPTHSDHSELDPDVRARLLDAVGQVIDRFGGGFTMAYETLLIRADLNP